MPLDTTLPINITAQSLTASSLASLQPLFARIEHTPSPEQWAAISDLLAHLEAAALGRLDPAAAYVSAIPAGTGKTTSIQAFARALTLSPEHSDTGMLIAVNRKQEARDMAGALADIRDSLCVICSEADVMALGDHTTAHRAQVVISTQAALKETLRLLRPFPRLRVGHPLSLPGTQAGRSGVG